MRHALTTRVLHLLLAGAIVLQLATSQIMRVPRPGRVVTPLEAAGFAVHQWTGLAAMGIVALFWLWLALRSVGTAPGQLFPWFSRRRLADLRDAVVLHVEAARRLTLPDPDQAEAMASALHGLGLLIALAMAVTGTVGWLTWDQSGPMDSFTHTMFDLHATIANLVWAYLVAHVGAAALHEFLGHRLLQRMNPVPQ